MVVRRQAGGQADTGGLMRDHIDTRRMQEHAPINNCDAHTYICATTLAHIIHFTQHQEDTSRI